QQRPDRRERDRRALELDVLGKPALPVLEHRVEVAAMYAAVGEELAHQDRLTRPPPTGVLEYGVVGTLAVFALGDAGGVDQAIADDQHHQRHHERDDAVAYPRDLTLGTRRSLLLGHFRVGAPRRSCRRFYYAG